MSYYPDHVYLQSSSTLTHPNPSLRRCSVKGCAKDLSPDYALKMCEACRGRHRKYATTKRAKRKQEKAAVGTQRIANDDGQIVTWIAQNHHVSLGPTPEDLDPVPDLHLSRIDPRLFNPTSSELAGALTLPPLDPSPSNDTQDVNDDATPTPTPTQRADDDVATPPPTTTRSSGQSRYCSVKGCRNVIGGDYLFKMCVSCRNRYRGYGLTKRSKSKRGREVAAQELRRVRAEEDVRRAQQGLPLIGELQAADRRAWERKVLGTIPRPAVVQYAPISVLPARMCTVSHCHTMLQGHYPYRRCERHRLQNRHHSKLKRVRDKEVKSTPLRSDDPESGSRTRGVESLYANEDAFETEGAGMSEDDIDESSIPPAARGSRRSNTVCSVKWCQNVLYHRSPWKMCDTHREKDRMNRRRKSGRDNDVPGDLDEGRVGQVGEHAAMAVDMGSDSDMADLDMADLDMADLEPETPAPTGSSAVFMEPLLPPDEAVPTTIQQQPEMSNYPGMPQDPQQVDSIHSYGSHLSETGVVTEVTTELDAAGNMDIGISTQPSLPEGSLVEEHRLDGQEISDHGQQDISSMIWGNDTSPVSTGGSDSFPSQSSPSSSRHSNTTAVADMSSSPATTSALETPVPAPSTETSTSASHTQPQLQMPYYMSTPFSVPFTPGQPSFLVPGPYPPVSYMARPAYTFGAPIPGPFQAFQYPAPPPGQLGSYALRPYPYPTWGSYTNGAVDANWADANAQTQAQVQMQTQGQVQGKAQRKRGRAAASGEDALRIVLVQPKNFLPDPDSDPDPAAASVACTDALTSTSSPVGPISDPGERPTASLSITNGPSIDVASTTDLATPADSEEPAATRPCSSEGCRRRLPIGALGSLCERCKTRLKRRQEKTKLRLKLEPRKARTPSRRLET